MRSYDQHSDLGGGNRRFGGGGGRREGGGSRGGFGGRRDGERPQMFTAVCDECGRNCEVPFRPTGEKPIYCDDCFAKRRNDDDRGNFRRPERSFDRPRFDRGEKRGGGDNHQMKEQMDALNSKLDRILRVLESQAMPAAKPAKEAKAEAAEAPVAEVKVAKAKATKKAEKKPAKKTTKKAKSE